MKRRSHSVVPERGPDSDLETVLVMTIGTSPSVLTSTIWALAHQQRVLPHQIRVLTTRLGRDRLIQQVFSPMGDAGQKTVWDSLCQNLEAQGFDLAGRLKFAPSPAYLRVYTATPPGERVARELDDITSQTENEQVADIMLETLRGVMNDDTRLIASIAGGRKTVSALFYACVSLIGRGDDRIIHVVVNEPFDRPDLQPPFFFPTQPYSRLKERAGKTVCATDAKLTIIEVPFVPLANLLQKELGRTPGRFSALVAKYRETVSRKSLATLRLKVLRNRLEIEVNDVPVSLARREQVLIIFLAEELLAGKKGYAKLDQAIEPMCECFNRLVAQAPSGDPSDWRHQLKTTWGKSWDHLDQPERRDQLKGEINRANSNLQKKLGMRGREPAELVAALPTSGRFSFAPELLLGNVTIEEA